MKLIKCSDKMPDTSGDYLVLSLTEDELEAYHKGEYQIDEDDWDVVYFNNEGFIDCVMSAVEGENCYIHAMYWAELPVIPELPIRGYKS